MSKFKLEKTKIGICDCCFRTDMTVLVYGLTPERTNYDYLCSECLEMFSSISPFFVCSGCECLLNEYFAYPTDSAQRDQTFLCKLCLDLILIEETVYNQTPKRERKALLKALKQK